MKALLVFALASLLSCTSAAPQSSSSAAPRGGPPASAAPSAIASATTTSPSAAPTDTAVDTVLPGSQLTLEEAARSAQTIVVARIVARGNPNSDAPMERYYDAAEAVVVRTLVGTPIEGTISINYKVKSAPAAAVTESAPREGEEYILFLGARGPNGHPVVKMLRATAENVAAAQRR